MRRRIGGSRSIPCVHSFFWAQSRCVIVVDAGLPKRCCRRWLTSPLGALTCVTVVGPGLPERCCRRRLTSPLDALRCVTVVVSGLSERSSMRWLTSPLGGLKCVVVVNAGLPGRCSRRWLTCWPPRAVLEEVVDLSPGCSQVCNCSRRWPPRSVL